MRPLTDHCPKPLLKVGQQTLLERHIYRLVEAGIRRIVINHAWLGEQIADFVKTLSFDGVELLLSDEGCSALETAGGIHNALGQLGSAPFLLVNGDVWSAFDFRDVSLPDPKVHGLIYLVENPPQHPEGDFELTKDGWVLPKGEHNLTYAGIAVLDPSVFEALPAGKQGLGPLLRKWSQEHKLQGKHLKAVWYDIGTPERLEAMNQRLLNQEEGACGEKF